MWTPRVHSFPFQLQAAGVENEGEKNTVYTEADKGKVRLCFLQHTAVVLEK